MSEFAPTDRTRLRRHRERSRPDVETAHAILDEALFCTLAVARDGVPLALPTIHARIGDQLYFHGARSNALLLSAVGSQFCCSVTVLDGLVLARTLLQHSVNFRSVVIFGEGRLVEDEQEKRAALEALVEHVARGRVADCPEMTDRDVKQTMVVALPIREASVKIRTGPPGYEEGDDPGVWGGVLPIRVVAGDPEPDEHVGSGLPTPAYLRDYRRGASSLS